VKLQRISLAPHDPRWAADFARESDRVKDACGNVAIAIHHIGSTAIPGILAKPIVDMLMVVTCVVELDERSPAIAALGYEVMGEFGIPGRRYFRKDDGEGNRTHNIHAFAAESREIDRHLAFCAYLRAHPEEAKQYETLKRELAERFPADIGSYTDGKGIFIREIDSRAAAWRGERTGE
jgi:GrpB-like predicted nucleotidyltransferase (UPF0157 family)